MFCRYCGKEISNDVTFCPNCGKQISQQQIVEGSIGFSSTASSADNHPLIGKFSERVKTNAIIWIVIGAIQILCGLVVQWWLLIVGILNLVTGISDIKYSSTVIQNPRGIVNRVKPLGGPIFTLIYNLFFGGVIGVAGSIYYLVGVRGFVLENECAFLEAENQNDSVC